MTTNETKCAACEAYFSNPTSRNTAGCMHSLTHRNRAYEGLVAIAATKDWDRFFRAVRRAQYVCRHTSNLDTLWAVAMTLKFGPTELHPSHGTVEEARAKFPSVDRAMQRAEDRIPGLLYSFLRDEVLGFATWAGLASDAAFPILYGLYGKTS